jgi:HEAT repeat protein
MSRLFPFAFRRQTLVAVSFLLAISTGGNVQGDRPEEKKEPTDTEKKVSKLTAALKDRSYWPDQYRAAQALEKLGPAAKDAVPALAAALKDPEPNVRMAVASALGKVASLSASPEALAALKTALKDDDPFVRRAATEACCLLVGNATNKDVAALIAVLKDTEPFIRREAARALGKIGTISSEVLTALKAAAKDDDPDVRRAATEAYNLVVGRATKEEVPALVAALKDSDPSIRREAARALGKVGTISLGALAALKAAAKDDDPDVRRAATEACSLVVGRATKEEVPALVAALKDTDPFIRREAARELGKVSSVFVFSSEALAALKEVAKDKDPDVSRAATRAWESIPPSMMMLALEPPLVEAFLRQGQLAEGEAALVKRLKNSPKDDQARFGLGVLRFVRGVERLGQSLHKYGAKSENTNIPFLRLPVPKNSDPAPINYAAFRSVLDDFHRDLSAAEEVLAGVTDDKVKLPLRLAETSLDLVGDGKSNDKFINILTKILQRQQFHFQESNPDFVVGFDRGDVAWLRAYCHLLMGMLDFYLAFDTEQFFNLSADQLFAKPEKPFRGEDNERRKNFEDAAKVIAVKEPQRLGRFRKHLIKVAELNRETWKYIRAETDDDHEWLPNPKQKGVFGLPVRDERIDSWLWLMAELEALLDGKRTFQKAFLNKNEKGLNLKTLLDDPPDKFVLDDKFPQNLPDKYWSEENDVALAVLFRVIQVFNDPTEMVYAVWFN